MSSFIYTNPNDPYEESRLVEYGSSISGEDFHVTDHYFNHIGLISFIVMLAGLVAVLCFVLSLYLRTQYEWIKCKPTPLEAEEGDIGDDTMSEPQPQPSVASSVTRSRGERRSDTSGARETLNEEETGARSDAASDVEEGTREGGNINEFGVQVNGGSFGASLPYFPQAAVIAQSVHHPHSSHYPYPLPYQPIPFPPHSSVFDDDDDDDDEKAKERERRELEKNEEVSGGRSMNRPGAYPSISKKSKRGSSKEEGDDKSKDDDEEGDDDDSDEKRDLKKEKESDDGDDDDDDNSDALYEARLNNKLVNAGVEHRVYNEDEDDEEEKLKNKKGGDGDGNDDLNEMEVRNVENYLNPHSASTFLPVAPYPIPYPPAAGGFSAPYPYPPPASYPYPVPYPYPAYGSGMNGIYEDGTIATGTEGRRDEDGTFARRRRSKLLNSEGGETTYSSPPRPYPWNWKRKANAVILYLLCFITLIFNQFFAISVSYASKGIDTAIKDLVSMKSSINAMFAYSDQFVSDGVSLQAAIQDAELTCTYHGHGYFTALERSLASYRVTSLDLANNISPLVSDIDTVESYQKYFASGAPLYILWILGMIVIGLIVYFSYRESRISLKATLAFSCSIFIVFIFSGTILMSLTMFFGDFCTNPSYNAVMNLPSTHNIQDLGAYYSTCNDALYSTFILQQPRSIKKEINFMYNRTLFAISNPDVCPNDPNLQTMNTVLMNANNTMSLFDHSAKCEPIQSMWYDMVNNGVCDEFYHGVFYAWGGQVLTSFFLFFLLITTSFTYQFYPNLHKSSFDENDSTTYPSEEEEERERELERATTMSGTRGAGDGSTIVGGDYDEKMDEKVDVEQGNDESQQELSRPSSIANYYPRNSYNVSRHSNPHPSPASKRKKRRSTNNISGNNNSNTSNSITNSRKEGDDNFVFHAASYEDDDNDEEGGGLSPPFLHMNRSTDMLLREDDDEEEVEEHHNDNSSSSFINNRSENTNSASDPFTSSTWGFDNNPSSMPI
jgi:hypothetical protein